jgi:regulator of RNase E activity RraA
VTGGADFAEMLPAAAGLEPGDVLVIDPDGQLIRSTEPYQASVAGVYSTKPGFVGGQPVEGTVAGAIPLAVVGVVPVKVTTENGAIRPGDLLVASAIPGHAMKAGPNPPQGTVIGKALEKLDASQGIGIIKMLATLQ